MPMVFSSELAVMLAYPVGVAGPSASSHPTKRARDQCRLRYRVIPGGGTAADSITSYLLRHGEADPARGTTWRM
ncbi:MAG: hypothetical protein ACNA7O_01060 [Rhodobacterales bacterium]